MWSVLSTKDRERIVVVYYLYASEMKFVYYAFSNVRDGVRERERERGRGRVRKEKN